jgi:phage shock protein C
MDNKLYRSSSDKFLGGVCGGIGKYLGVDSSFVRIIFLLLMFGSGIGFLLYILLWVILPQEGATATGLPLTGPEFEKRVQGVGDDIRDAARNPHPKAGLLVGIALIIIGGILFLEQLHFAWLSWLNVGIIWPVLVILIGGAFLYRGLKKGS